jgi:hypothetical protein
MTFVSLPISPGAVETAAVLFCIFMFCGICYGCFGCVWMASQWKRSTRQPAHEETAALVEAGRVQHGEERKE